MEGLLIEMVIKKKDVPQKQYFCGSFLKPQRAGISQDVVLFTLQMLDEMWCLLFFSHVFFSQFPLAVTKSFNWKQLQCWSRWNPHKRSLYHFGTCLTQHFSDIWMPFEKSCLISVKVISSSERSVQHLDCIKAPRAGPKRHLAGRTSALLAHRSKVKTPATRAGRWCTSGYPECCAGAGTRAALCPWCAVPQAQLLHSSYSFVLVSSSDAFGHPG